MEKLREHVADDSGTGKRGMRRLTMDAAASTAELRDFVRSLKGRSPQEVMGIVSSSALAQAMVGATVATVALIAVLTVGPYMYYGPPKAKAAKPEPAVAATEPSKSSGDSAKGSNSSDTPSEEDIKKASKAMGLDETKTADPKKNPLDTFDKLLDNVK